MKIIANILFERLHRKVYDRIYIHESLRHKDNQVTEQDLKNERLYNKLFPYFIGWRFSLKINLWWVKKYRRYEPKKLDLMNYEFNKLSVWNKFIYSIRYEFSIQKKLLKSKLV